MTSSRAFSLIELVIVIVLISLLSVGFALSSVGLRESNAFKIEEQEVVDIIQRARNLSLSNQQIDSQPVNWYRLTIGDDFLEIDYSVDTNTDSLEVHQLPEEWDFEIDFDEGQSIELYYFPPDGKMCFTRQNCNNPDLRKGFTLQSASNPELSTHFSIDVYGGHPEIDQTP